ncbi:MAG: Clp protease ClpP [Oscillospiraceae bacterium]|nr:Clp protease ClpP [Oscillospiraceae bacterium]
MAKLRIAGVIIPNDYKWFYDYFEEESTCPADVQQAIDTASGEELEVEINSPGGEIASGSEIYTMLRRCGNVRITVTGEACSAASIIAMAGHCEMSPTSLMMVHRVSTRAEGNCNTMDKASEMLRAADEALSSAYCAKSGMSQDEALSMMDAETWITPQRALELKLIDGILCKAAILGAESDDDANAISYGGEDDAPFGAYGFYCNKMDANKTRYYEVVFYPKVQGYVEGQDYKTKESTITLEYDELSFYIFQAECGKYKIEARFESESEAQAYLAELFAGTASVPGLTTAAA